MSRFARCGGEESEERPHRFRASRTSAHETRSASRASSPRHPTSDPSRLLPKARSLRGELAQADTKIRPEKKTGNARNPAPTITRATMGSDARMLGGTRANASKLPRRPQAGQPVGFSRTLLATKLAHRIMPRIAATTYALTVQVVPNNRAARLTPVTSSSMNPAPIRSSDPSTDSPRLKSRRRKSNSRINEAAATSRW